MVIPVTRYKPLQKQGIMVKFQYLSIANKEYKEMLIHGAGLSEEDAELHLRLYPLKLANNRSMFYYIN